MNDQNQTADDEISLIDIYVFIQKRFKKLLLIFFVLLSAIAVLILAQPTVYRTTIQMVIGKDQFFSNAGSLIESPDQIKHRFGPNPRIDTLKDALKIDALKNTGILNIVSEQPDHESSVRMALETANRIIHDHQALRDEKIQQFQLFLKATHPGQDELMRMIDAASSSMPTRITQEPFTEVLPYRGWLAKGLAIGFMVSAFVSLVLVLVLDTLQKIRSALPQHG